MDMSLAMRSLSVLMVLIVDHSVAAPPASCVRPHNAISIEWSKVKGVWHEQMGVNFGPVVYDLTCDRTDYLTTSNTTAIVVKYVFVRSTGEFSPMVSHVTLIDNGIIELEVYDNPSIVLYNFPLMLTDDVFITTNCYTSNNKLLSQLTAVLTREATVNRTYLHGLLRKVKVDWHQAYYFDNRKDCYKLHCDT